jgi:PIN like domain
LRILLDENVARPLHHALRAFVLGHEIAHIHDLDGWAGTKDFALYQRAADEGFHVVVTNGLKQMHRRLEVQAIARSGIHRIQYRHKTDGLRGLGVAIGTVCAGLPLALELLQQADSQRLIDLRGIDPLPSSRLVVTDPAVRPPAHWPSETPEDKGDV